nr:hypothetical protein CFP56_57794 [Quercus suber]
MFEAPDQNGGKLFNKFQHEEESTNEVGRKCRFFQWRDDEICDHVWCAIGLELCMLDWGGGKDVSELCMVYWYGALGLDEL